jgi:hypothetical protein
MTERKLTYRRVKCYSNNGCGTGGINRSLGLHAHYRVRDGIKVIDSFLKKKNMLKAYSGIKERP